MERSRDFVLAQGETVAIVDADGLILRHPLGVVVVKNTVLAPVGEEIGSLFIFHDAVQFGQNAFRVLQHPIALSRAADGKRPAIQGFAGFLVGREPLIASDG